MSRASTTTDSGRQPGRIRTHPGEVLREEFMQPLGLSANALALALRVPATRIGAIIPGSQAARGHRRHGAPPGRYFGTTPEFWLNLQNAYELSVAQGESGPRIEREVQPRAA